MKRIIRHKQTRQFLSQDGGWTKNVRCACHFKDTRAAIEAEQQYDLRDIELLLLMGEAPGEYDVVLPLGPSLGESNGALKIGITRPDRSET